MRKEGRWTWTSSQLPFEVGLTGWTEAVVGRVGVGVLFVLCFFLHTLLAWLFPLLVAELSCAQTVGGLKHDLSRLHLWVMRQFGQVPES